jgi:hypothetical protein
MHAIANGLKPHGPSANIRSWLCMSLGSVPPPSVGSCLPRGRLRRRRGEAFGCHSTECTGRVVKDVGRDLDFLAGWLAVHGFVRVAGGIAMIGSREIEVEAPDAAKSSEWWCCCCCWLLKSSAAIEGCNALQCRMYTFVTQHT